MTIRDRLIKNALFFLLLIYYLGGYFLIGWMTGMRSDIHQLALPWDRQLPFIPQLIFAYLMVFVFLATGYVAVDDLSFFKKIAKSLFICTTIHFIIFLIFPVEYILRPVVENAWGGIYSLVAFYYWLDPVYNCFPSMHISNVFLVSFFLDRYRPGWGRVLVPLACLVAISVVLVKQHYIVDVVSGLLVAWGVFRWVFGARPSPSTVVATPTSLSR